MPLPCPQTNPKLHDTIIERLMDTFPAVRASRVCSCALWIISEYCTRSAEEIASAVEMIKGCLGPLPLFKEHEAGEEEEAEAPSLPIPIQLAAARPAVLADGSYATQTALPGEGAGGAAGNAAAAAAASNVPNLRALLLGGDYFLGAVIAATLTKLVLRLRELRALPPASINRLSADVMLLIAGMLRLGESGAAAQAGVHPMDADSRDRIATCLRTLAGGDDGAARVWLEECRTAFAALIADKQQREAAEAKQEVRWGQGLSSAPQAVHPSKRCSKPVPAYSRCLISRQHAVTRPVVETPQLPTACGVAPSPPPALPALQKAKSVAQPDELIDFHHLKMRKGLSKVELEVRRGLAGQGAADLGAPAGWCCHSGCSSVCCLPGQAAGAACRTSAGHQCQQPSLPPAHPTGRGGLGPGTRHGHGGCRRGRQQPAEQDCAADGLQRPHLRRGIRDG